MNKVDTLFIFLVVLAKIQDNEAISTKPYRFRVDNAENRKNREELAQIIKYINDNADTEIEQNEEPDIGVDNGKYNLEDMMKLAQHNYDTRLEYDLKKPGSSVRVHVINNPEVLQEYVKNLRRRHHSTSSESSDSDSDFDRMQRRYADDENIKDQLNESLENTKKKKTFVKGNIDFKIKDGQQKHGNNIKSSEKYDDDPIQVETPTKQKKKKSDINDDTWAAIKKNDNDDVKDDTDKFKTTRRDFKIKKNTYKDYDSPSQKERKKDTVMKRKNSWENEDNSWKKTTKRTERWEVGNKKKEYDSFESKTKKKKITHDYAPLKNNKKYDDDDNWTKKEHSKRTTRSWDKPTNLWERNTIRKKQRGSYAKPSYNSGHSDYHKIGRYGGGSSFLGRTPIPFVGKKGIYEDK